MVRRGGLIALTTLVIASGACGQDGGVVRQVGAELVPTPLTRPSAPPDVAAARILSLPGTLLAAPKVSSVDVHAAPGTDEPYMDLSARNPWQQPLRFLVRKDALDDDGDIWLRVQLPIWPNGQEGWVAADDVRLSRPAQRIVVDLSDRTLVRYRRNHAVARLPVAVGKPSTPTPPGRYVVWASVDTGLPSGPYGSYILGLSGFSDTIQPSDWPGDPRLAIHGTDDPTDAGQAISSGCIRVFNALLRQLDDVPIGTPVVVRP